MEKSPDFAFKTREMLQNIYLQTNTTLDNGKYRIESLLGKGGFGITYLATHVLLNKQVAIKEFFIQGCFRNESSTVNTQTHTVEHFTKFKQRFIEEAQLIAKITSDEIPNCVKVFDVFQENNTAYYVMNYIDGTNLKTWLEAKHILPENLAVKYIREICESLKIFHKHNVIHRDIKPDNIIINSKNNAVLIDFGSAREFVNEISMVHSVIISQGYAPIEQYDYKKKRGAYTDIYGIGATLYRMITGNVPLIPTSRFDEDMPTAKTLNPDISDKLNSAITKALEIKPQDRFQTIDDFLNSLPDVYYKVGITEISENKKNINNDGKFDSGFIDNEIKNSGFVKEEFNDSGLIDNEQNISNNSNISNNIIEIENYKNNSGFIKENIIEHEIVIENEKSETKENIKIEQIENTIQLDSSEIEIKKKYKILTYTGIIVILLIVLYLFSIKYIKTETFSNVKTEIDSTKKLDSLEQIEKQIIQDSLNLIIEKEKQDSLRSLIEKQNEDSLTKIELIKNIKKGKFKDDRDGKTYKWVKIGDQTWMAENLAYKPIKGNFWIYDDGYSNYAKYGYLYDWETANNVCPTEWHLPSQIEFETLLNNVKYIDTIAYNALIPSGKSGFSILLGGYWYSDGGFKQQETEALIWSSTLSGRGAIHLWINSNFKVADMGFYYRDIGYSVRCIKDN